VKTKNKPKSSQCGYSKIKTAACRAACTPHYFNMRDGRSESPSASSFLVSFSLQHRFVFTQISIVPLSFESTDPGSFAGSVATTLNLLQDLFMQPESTAVSQHTPPVDSSPIKTSSTQHGHDLDDAEVSGFLEREETRALADVPSMSTQDEPDAFLNGVDGRPVPSSADRVSKHTSAQTHPRQVPNAGLRLVKFDEQPQVSFETFPNGRYPAFPPHNSL
jgi:hypothetical protein